jgi:hypothetical protein
MGEILGSDVDKYEDNVSSGMLHQVFPLDTD